MGRIFHAYVRFGAASLPSCQERIRNSCSGLYAKVQELENMSRHFLIQNGLEIIPIEVKAEDNVNGKSFAEYNKKYEPRIRLRFSLLNIKRNGNMINFPIFLCDWLNDLLPVL